MHLSPEAMHTKSPLFGTPILYFVYSYAYANALLVNWNFFAETFIYLAVNFLPHIAKKISSQNIGKSAHLGD